MTTLAIIGGGIAGRSLAYTLAKEKKKYSKILIFQSDSFAFPCSKHSTAIVAPRGVSTGHSVLGDLLKESFEAFVHHVKAESPQGVFSITQYTGAENKLEQFKRRYASGEETQSLGGIRLKRPMYVAWEEAYLVDPEIYLKWLLSEALLDPRITLKNEFITSIDEASGILETQDQKVYEADEIVIAAGSYSRFWKSLGEDSKLKSSKPVQGSYLEFERVNLGENSFSLTLEGDNLIYHAHSKKILLGSTTAAIFHELPPQNELACIYQRLKDLVDLNLPPYEKGTVRVGLREKSSKRAPYMVLGEKISFAGGYYKNGYSLAIRIGQEISSHLLRQKV